MVYRGLIPGYKKLKLKSQDVLLWYFQYQITAYEMNKGRKITLTMVEREFVSRNYGLYRPYSWLLEVEVAGCSDLVAYIGPRSYLTE